jgi:hypothetical protein
MKNTLWACLGVLLGFAIGVGYAWVIHPADLQGSTPDALRAEYRGEYLLLIASSYQTTGDIHRARNRLAAFPGLDAAQIASLAQQVAASGGGEQTARDLAALALALGQQTALPGPSETPMRTIAVGTVLPASSAEPTIAFTISPLPSPAQQTAIPSPAVADRFRLESKETVCENSENRKPQIQIWLKSAEGKGIPGLEFFVRWNGGSGRMVTGMKPDVDPGYADYEIDPGLLYEVSLGDGTFKVSGLQAPDCSKTGSGKTAGAIRLILVSR